MEVIRTPCKICRAIKYLTHGESVNDKIRSTLIYSDIRLIYDPELSIFDYANFEFTTSLQ